MAVRTFRTERVRDIRLRDIRILNVEELIGTLRQMNAQFFRIEEGPRINGELHFWTVGFYLLPFGRNPESDVEYDNDALTPGLKVAFGVWIREVKVIFVPRGYLTEPHFVVELSIPMVEGAQREFLKKWKDSVL